MLLCVCYKIGCVFLENNDRICKLVYKNIFFKKMNSSIKKIAIGILILSIIVITFIILLSIWDIINPYILWKSIFTIIVVGIASLIVTITVKVTGDNK